MALSRVKTWVVGEVLTAADLNNEFSNILDNSVSLVSPWVGNFDLNGNTLILDEDADTSIDAATDDTIDITVAGADDFRITANTFTALSGSSIVVANGNLTVTDGQTTLADPGSQTNTVVTPLTVESTTSGTPAAGIGTGIVFNSESQDENPSNFGQIEFAATDITTGSEDTYFQVLTRVAGAALTAVYRFVATGAFKGIFTHANTADRTYTFQNADYTVIGRNTTDTLTNKTFDAQGTGNSLTNVSTSALKTATGSATSGIGTPISITMNDYSFFPATFDSSSSIVTMSPFPGADPSNTVGRFYLGTATGTTVGARWRYVTSSDNPVIWVAYDPATGILKGAWASDDPTPDDVPGVESPGCLSIKLTSRDLESFSLLSTVASEAQAYIRDRKLRMAHQAYRALQLVTNDVAPSGWVIRHCRINPTTHKLEMT